jgi:hypothetical protein
MFPNVLFLVFGIYLLIIFLYSFYNAGTFTSETHCEIHDSFDLYDGRKPVGGKVSQCFLSSVPVSYLFFPRRISFVLLAASAKFATVPISRN